MITDRLERKHKAILIFTVNKCKFTLKRKVLKRYFLIRSHLIKAY